MKRPSTKVVVAALSVALAGISTAAWSQQPGSPVIVVFKPGASLQSFSVNYHADERMRGNPAAWGYLNRGVVGAVQELEARHGFRADHVYSAALRGFAAQLTAGQIESIKSDDRVLYVEADGTMTAIAQTVPWGIRKIGADVSPTANAGNGSGAITNVHAYVIDTGVDDLHPDLNAVQEVNFAGGPNKDCHGHGTHVSGTIGAKDNAQDVVGVAPGVRIHGVKVLGCGGSGTTSGVIKGVDWVTDHASKPAVANMSLGGGASTALDNAVAKSANGGVFYALAAGNEGANACNSSPARAGAGANNGIATTAATDSGDNEASWSNYGNCVDIWAPGVSILSTKKGGGTTTMSGTSMASPHVAGAAAVWLSKHTADTPGTVEAALKSAAQNASTTSKDGRSIQRLYIGSF